MLIRVEQIPSQKIRNGSSTIDIGIVTCDQCGVNFEVRNDRITREFHFCCRACKTKSCSHGVLRDKTSKTCLERFGVAVPTQAEHVKEKSKKTNLERYGVEYTGQAEVKLHKTKETFQCEYGVDCALQHPLFLERYKRTSLNRYGTEHPNKCEKMREKISIINSSAEVKSKKEETCLRNYGMAHPMQNEGVKSKFRQSMLTRHGVSNPFESQEICAAAGATCLIRYGTMVPMRNIAVKNKKLRTQRANNTFNVSKPEDLCWKFLCCRYGTKNVERNVTVNYRWPVDFLIVSLATFVQIDGVYYHGLDRPLAEISKHCTATDVQIHKKYLTDREQDIWFPANNIKLVRVTDIELSIYSKEPNFEILAAKIEKINA
jgi:hypothetical protein